MKNRKFRKIALMGRPGVVGLSDTLNALKDYLISLNIRVMIAASSASLLNTPDIPVVSRDDLNKYVELLIVVGGDGSLLNAAHVAVQQKLPVLGINRGRLGFLTDIRPDEITKIQAILQGEYQNEKRFLLQAHIEYQGKCIAEDLALNDVVLLPGDIAQMISFETAINDEFVCNQRADGLIVTSPTGSTAYALSGGGPILHPQLDAIALVPMFPHTLSSRPIVVQSDCCITLSISGINEVSPYLSCDGQNRIAVPPGGVIKIRKKKEYLHLIHDNHYNYYRTLREKLGWECNKT